MKVHYIFAVAGIVLVSQLARAEEPKPDPKVLAMTEAVLAYCTKADPSMTAKYQESLQQVTKGASEEALADLRKSDAYRQARESLEGFLSQVDEHNTDKVCSRSPTQKP